MSEVGRFTVSLTQGEAYGFNVKFDWPRSADLFMDESPPLGGQAGPNASRLLAAAVGNCLSASLLFCLTKDDPPDESLQTEVTCTVVSNEKKRMRIGDLEVNMRITGDLADSPRFERCLKLFEDFCTVSASLRDGIPIAVNVLDEAGKVLYRDAQTS